MSRVSLVRTRHGLHAVALAAPHRQMTGLAPGQSIDLPLPPLALGRRVVYQRIQRNAYILFGSGNYRMRADGACVRVMRLWGKKHAV